MFFDAKTARIWFCRHKPCANCSMYAPARAKGLSCDEYCETYPFEAARLMGYDITLHEEGRMDKPLRDWTLDECKEYCENRKVLEDMCGGCEIREWCDAMTNEDKVTPEEWELPPKYTAEEIETAQSLVNIWPDLKLYRHGDQVLEMRSAEYGVNAYIKPDAFPSVGTKRCVTVQEIAESRKRLQSSIK